VKYAWMKKHNRIIPQLITLYTGLKSGEYYIFKYIEMFYNRKLY